MQFLTLRKFFFGEKAIESETTAQGDISTHVSVKPLDYFREIWTFFPSRLFLTITKCDLVWRLLSVRPLFEKSFEHFTWNRWILLTRWLSIENIVQKFCILRLISYKLKTLTTGTLIRFKESHREHWRANKEHTEHWLLTEPIRSIKLQPSVCEIIRRRRRQICSSTPFLEGPASRRANPDRKQKPPLFTSCTQ